MKTKILAVTFVLLCLFSVCTVSYATSWGDLFHGKTLEDYKKFLIEERQPLHFMRYDCFSILGEFDGLTIPAGYISPYTKYSYYFEDSYTKATPDPYDDFTLHVSVFNEDIPDGYTELTSLPSEIEDMRNLGVLDGPKYYVRGGMYYRYYGNGELCDIRFSFFDTYFWINLENYPLLGQETFVSRFLSKDDNVALSAFQELKIHMGFRRVMHFLPGIVLTAAVATITLVTVRRIKEENQQPTEEITE